MIPNEVEMEMNNGVDGQTADGVVIKKPITETKAAEREGETFTEQVEMLNKINNRLLNGARVKFEFVWDAVAKSECVSLSDDKRTAYFFDNPFTISRGTAGVRADRAAGAGVTYFEVLVKEPLYGTAVMIGFGNANVRLHYENFEYVFLVGNDQNAWGLCHKGLVWHNNRSKAYCEAFFDKGHRIGALLNTYDRTISFFLNGQHLGVAFRDVNSENENLYPMISSTATDVELQLVDSFKVIYSLEDMCYKKISQSLNRSYDSIRLPKSMKSHLNQNY